MPPDESQIYGYPVDIDQVTRKLKVGVVSATHLAKRGVLFGSNDPYIKVTYVQNKIISTSNTHQGFENQTIQSKVFLRRCARKRSILILMRNSSSESSPEAAQFSSKFTTQIS